MRFAHRFSPVTSDAAKRIFAERTLVIELTDHRGRPSGSRPGPDYRDRLDELGARLGLYDGLLAWQICAPGLPAAYVSAESASVLYFHSGIVAHAPNRATGTDRLRRDSRSTS